MAIITVSFLTFLLIIQLYGFLFQINLEKVFKYFFGGSILFIVLYWFSLGFFQIQVWQSMGPPAIYLAPPYESFLYAFEYHFFRFGIYYLVSLIISFVFLFYTNKMNKDSKELFFEKEEPYLGAVSIFLMGTTGLAFGWIYYVLAIVLIPFMVTFYRSFFNKKLKEERVPLRFLWLPVSILVILIYMII